MVRLYKTTTLDIDEKKYLKYLRNDLGYYDEDMPETKEDLVDYILNTISGEDEFELFAMAKKMGIEDINTTGWEVR